MGPRFREDDVGWSGARSLVFQAVSGVTAFTASPAFLNVTTSAFKRPIFATNVFQEFNGA
jgi:hypothetical protein